MSHQRRGQRSTLPLQAAGSLPQRPRSCHPGGQLGGHSFLPAGRGQRQGAGRRPEGPQRRARPQPLAGWARVLPGRHRLLLLRAAKRLRVIRPCQRPALAQVLRQPGPLRLGQASSAVTGAAPGPDTRKGVLPKQSERKALEY